jgi:hypothetical protein
MKELAEVKSSVLQLHKGAEKRLEAFIQVAMRSFTFVLPLMSRSSLLMQSSQFLQAEHREWDQMLGSPSPKKMIGNGHLPDIHNKDVRMQRVQPLFGLFFCKSIVDS